MLVYEKDHSICVQNFTKQHFQAAAESYKAAKDTRFVKLTLNWKNFQLNLS